MFNFGLGIDFRNIASNNAESFTNVAVQVPISTNHGSFVAA